MCKNVTFHGITVLEVKAGMRFFRDLDDAPKSEPPLGAPFHDTDGWGSFPGPSLDDEHEEESHEEYVAVKACDFHIPDLEVPSMSERVQKTGANVTFVSAPPKRLSAELTARLAEELGNMMNQYEYTSRGADYVCAFCRNRHWDLHLHDTNHTRRCLGVALVADLAKD